MSETEKERIDESVKELLREAVRGGEAVRSLLHTMSRIGPGYSGMDALRIAAQAPDASLLKTPEEWQALGHPASPDAKRVRIFPGETEEGLELVDVKQVPSFFRPALTLNGDPEREICALLDRMRPKTRLCGELPEPELLAYYDNSEGTVFVRRGEGDPADLFRDLVRECAYASFSERSETYSRRRLSYPAVCAAVYCCVRFGVDDSAFSLEGAPPDLKKTTDSGRTAFLLSVREVAEDLCGRMAPDG